PQSAIIKWFRQGESRQVNPTAITANRAVDRKGFRQGSLIPFIGATASGHGLPQFLGDGCPRPASTAKVGNLGSVDYHTRTAQGLALRPGVPHTGPDALDNQALLEFRHCADDVE